MGPISAFWIGAHAIEDDANGRNYSRRTVHGGVDRIRTDAARATWTGRSRPEACSPSPRAARHGPRN